MLPGGDPPSCSPSHHHLPRPEQCRCGRTKGRDQRDAPSPTETAPVLPKAPGLLLGLKQWFDTNWHHIHLSARDGGEESSGLFVEETNASQAVAPSTSCPSSNAFATWNSLTSRTVGLKPSWRIDCWLDHTNSGDYLEYESAWFCCCDII